MKEKKWRSRPEKVRQLVKALVDMSLKTGDNNELLEVLNNGIKAVESMLTLKKMKVPKCLACPMAETTELMEDPVVLQCSGVTFDHHNILGYLEDGNSICPVSLSPIQSPEDATLIPNKLAKRHIADWCALKGYPRPTINSNTLETLLISLSSENHLSTKKAASELHTICRRRKSSWSFLSQSQDRVTQLIAPLLKMQSAEREYDHVLEEDLIFSIYYMSLQGDERNLRIIAETPGFLSALGASMDSANLTARKFSICTVSELGKVESNAILMYSEGLSKSVLNPLFLASEGQESSVSGASESMDDESIFAADAIDILFSVPTNREKAVDHGIVKMFYSIVEKRIFLDMLAPTLVSLSSTQKSAHELGKLGALGLMPWLINDSETPLVKESFLLVIFNLIKTFKEPDKVKKLLEAEETLCVISELATNGWSKGVKKRANKIISFLNKADYPTLRYEDDMLTEGNRDTLSTLLAQLVSWSLSMRKQAAQTLREITSVKVSAAAFFYSPSLEELVAPLLSHESAIDINIEGDLIETVFNISKHHPIMKSTPMVIRVLTSALKSVRIETITHAISALELLSRDKENAKTIFENMDAIKPLLDLLIAADSEYHNHLMKEAVTETICNLFVVHDNLKKAVGKGLLVTICSKLAATSVTVQEGLLSIINVFSESTEAVERWADHDLDIGLFNTLFLLVKDITGSPVIKEKCVSIIHNMLSNSKTNTKLRLKVKEENVENATISDLAENPVTREMASRILTLIQDI